MVGPLFFLFATFGEIWFIQVKSLTHMPASASVLAATYLVMYTMSIISVDVYNTLTDCTVALSMITNLLATLLIAYKLWLANIRSDINDDFLLVFLTGPTGT
jgi:hypothetical protein